MGPRVQMQAIERVVEVPHTQEVVRHVDVVQHHESEVIRHVPRIETVERVVEVPRVQMHAVEKIVHVPQVHESIRHVEVPGPVHHQEVVRHEAIGAIAAPTTYAAPVATHAIGGYTTGYPTT